MLWVAPYAPHHPGGATASPLTSTVVMKSAARALTASHRPQESKSAHRSHPPAHSISMRWAAPYAPQPWALMAARFIKTRITTAWARCSARACRTLQMRSPVYTTTTYDDLGRVSQVERPDTSVVNRSYGVDTGQHLAITTTTETVLDHNGQVVNTKAHISRSHYSGDLHSTTDAVGTPEEVSTHFDYYGTGLPKNHSREHRTSGAF